MLEEVRRNYIATADAVKPNWRTTNVNTLCDLYIDNENDEVLKSGYFAGIVLKKWGYIGKHYINSKASGFTIEDCYGMVTDAIMIILKARKWRDPSNKLYGDKNAPDKCLNRCIFSMRQRDYYLANRQKRKVNYGGNKVSLTQLQEQVGDHSAVLATDSDRKDSVQTLDYKNVISNLLSNNRGLEGIIVENILRDECFVTKYKIITDEEGHEHKRAYEEFKLCKLVDNISKYNNDSINHIYKTYGVSVDKGAEVSDIINSVNKAKLSRIIKATMTKMSKDRALKESLCC